MDPKDAKKAAHPSTLPLQTQHLLGIAGAPDEERRTKLKKELVHIEKLEPPKGQAGCGVQVVGNKIDELDGALLVADGANRESGVTAELKQGLLRIPDGLKPGAYQVYLKRGGDEAPPMTFVVEAASSKQAK
jgi:hypothetical protein